MAVLLIDQGNTAVKFQLRDLDGHVLSNTINVPNYAEFNAVAKKHFSSKAITHIVTASVAKPEAKAWLNTLVANFDNSANHYIAITQTRLCTRGIVINNSYKDPNQMGVDRWLAIIASALRYSNQPVVVVDAGSAITIEIIDNQATHIGGYIIPGVSAMLESLYQGTGQVRVKDKISSASTTEPGAATVDCVNSGIIGAVTGLIKQSLEILEQPPSDHDVKLVMTGGDAPLLAGYLMKSVDIQPDLVLDGLFHWFTVNCI